jgi:hypothetical protein
MKTEIMPVRSCAELTRKVAILLGAARRATCPEMRQLWLGQADRMIVRALEPVQS